MSSSAELSIKTISTGTSTFLRGPEENAQSNNSELCSICQGMLIRPFDGWNESIGNQPCYINRAVNDVASSMTNGCIICAILWDSILSTRKSRPWVDDGSETIACMLHWTLKAVNLTLSNLTTTCKFILTCIWMKVSSARSIYLSNPSCSNRLRGVDVNYSVHGDKNKLRNTSSDASWELIKPWLTDCTKDHRGCNQEAKQNRWFPTRLIDVGIRKSGGAPRLILTAEARLEAGKDAYLALSHSWGSKQMVTLTTENITAFQDEILVDKLAPTFKDAVLVARRLSIRYLWIDSLCIVQNSEDD